MDYKQTIIDLYKGFEGEPGFFFAANTKDGETLFYIKAWGGYVLNIIYENPHAEEDGLHGLTKLFHEDIVNDFDYPLDNFYKVKDKKDFLHDLMWYKKNRYEQYDKETKELLDGLIDLVTSTISNDLVLLVANDEE